MNKNHNRQDNQQDNQSAVEPKLPEDALLILPVRNLVMFPGAVTQIALGRDFSIAAAREAVNSERKLGILLQRDGEMDMPAPADLYTVGTIVSVIRLSHFSSVFIGKFNPLK